MISLSRKPDRRLSLSGLPHKTVKPDAILKTRAKKLFGSIAQRSALLRTLPENSGDGVLISLRPLAPNGACIEPRDPSDAPMAQANPPES